MVWSMVRWGLRAVVLDAAGVTPTRSPSSDQSRGASSGHRRGLAESPQHLEARGLDAAEAGSGPDVAVVSLVEEGDALLLVPQELPPEPVVAEPLGIRGDGVGVVLHPAVRVGVDQRL